jgi:vacuolar protein sorting-associated protein IST1
MADPRPDPEPSIEDAVCAIVYAAPRTELKELQVLREMLMHKVSRSSSLCSVSTTLVYLEIDH